MKILENNLLKYSLFLLGVLVSSFVGTLAGVLLFAILTK
jgi:hypothetical protein